MATLAVSQITTKDALLELKSQLEKVTSAIKYLASRVKAIGPNKHFSKATDPSLSNKTKGYNKEKPHTC